MGCPETARYANIRLFIVPITSETIKQRMFCSVYHSECRCLFFNKRLVFFLRGVLCGVVVGERVIEGG